MTDKELQEFYRANKEEVESLVLSIYFSKYTPRLTHHDDFAEKIKLSRQDAKVLAYICMWKIGYSEDTPWVLQQLHREQAYSYRLSLSSVKQGYMTKVQSEIVEDLASDLADAVMEKLKNEKLRRMSQK